MPKEERFRDAHTLAENGITIHYDDAQVTISTAQKEHLKTNFPQASLVTEGLLDCLRIISTSSFESLSERGKKTVRKRYPSCLIPSLVKKPALDKESYEEKYQVAAHDARFELAKRISKVANNIESEKETRWSNAVKNELFGKLINSSHRAEGARMIDPRHAVDKVRVEDEDTWQHGHKALRRTTPATAAALTAPRADLYIALPVISRSSRPKGFHRDDYVQNFTESCLAHLENADNGNLISNPITPFEKGKVLKKKDMVCFPCAVIEIKHHKVSTPEIQDCYMQAANASATALSMLARLSHLSIPNRFSNEIQPVVAFTFIGYGCKVWIAYISHKHWQHCTRCQDCKKHQGCPNKRLECKYEMQCIGAFDLRIVWDTVRLCRIIENLHHWTLKHFRPWVSSCIDRWRWIIRADNTGIDCYVDDIEDLRREVLTNNGPSEEEAEQETEGEEEDEEEEEEGYSTFGDDDESAESEDESEGDQDQRSPRQEVSIMHSNVGVATSRQRLRTRPDIPATKSKTVTSGNLHTPPRYRKAATLSPESADSRRPRLHHGETSPLPYRRRSVTGHARSRSTGTP